MKSRKNYLKYRRKIFKWNLIGWHSDSECIQCGQKTIYQIYKYDAWCCISCNEWLDAPCSDPDCPFCSRRPQTPYEAYFLAEPEIAGAGERKLWRRMNYQHKTDGKRKHQRYREAMENIKQLMPRTAQCALRHMRIYGRMHLAAGNSLPILGTVRGMSGT